jgi:IS30 family transposase
MGGKRLAEPVKAELWRRWKAGETVSEIARALGKRAGSIHHVLVAQGGVVPRSRHRSVRGLTLAEREEISRGLCAQATMRQIARRIGRAASSVSREIARHGGPQRYRAAVAEARTWDRARRPKLCKLAQRGKLAQVVAHKLSLNWSPAQISGWLEEEFAGEDSMQVSHETIYRTLFIQARGVLKKELIGHLRLRRRMRRVKGAHSVGKPGGQIPDAVSIRERPAQALDRAVPGHWEGDLITGRQNTYIATLVERHSRFVMLVKVPGKDTASVVKALSKKVLKLPVELRRSLTWDRGSELAAHKDFTLATDVQVYFCDPHSPWQRGSNENTNGLLRQYFPKGTDLSVHSQADLDRVALQMNQRPRETLGFKTPAYKLNLSVASTG